MSFLRDEVGLEEIRLRKLLVTTPVLFSYNVETMRSKVSYLQEELQFDCEDVSTITSVYYLSLARCTYLLCGEDTTHFLDRWYIH